MSVKKILQSITEKVPSGLLSRADLITRKDIYNISKAYKIPTKDLEPPVILPMEEWLAECLTSSGVCPILYHKKKGEARNGFHINDYCVIYMGGLQRRALKSSSHKLIAVDSTLGLKNYDFEMVTLFVVDEFGRPCPGIYMFSNRKGQFMYELLFRVIRDQVCNIETKVFLTDLDMESYNAFKEVFPPAQHVLYSPWYIDRAWQSSLELIRNKVKMRSVYKRLKVLLEETTLKAFEGEFDRFLFDINTDPETEEFGENFNESFSTNYPKWAQCYRKAVCDFKIVAPLKSLHEIVRYFAWKKQTVKKLDEGIDAAMDYLLKRHEDWVCDVKGGKSTRKTAANFKKHQAALSSTYNILYQDESTFLLEHPSQGRNFSVMRGEETSKCCDNRCGYCKICIHCYICECPDFMKKIICEHIHFVHQTEVKAKEKSVSTSRASSALSAPVASTSFAEEGRAEASRTEAEDAASVLVEYMDIGADCSVESPPSPVEVERGGSQSQYETGRPSSQNPNPINKPISSVTSQKPNLKWHISSQLSQKPNPINRPIRPRPTSEMSPNPINRPISSASKMYQKPNIINRPISSKMPQEPNPINMPISSELSQNPNPINSLISSKMTQKPNPINRPMPISCGSEKPGGSIGLNARAKIALEKIETGRFDQNTEKLLLSHIEAIEKLCIPKPEPLLLIKMPTSGNTAISMPLDTQPQASKMKVYRPSTKTPVDNQSQSSKKNVSSEKLSAPTQLLITTTPNTGNTVVCIPLDNQSQESYKKKPSADAIEKLSAQTPMPLLFTQVPNSVNTAVCIPVHDQSQNAVILIPIDNQPHEFSEIQILHEAIEKLSAQTPKPLLFTTTPSGNTEISMPVHNQSQSPTPKGPETPQTYNRKRPITTTDNPQGECKKRRKQEEKKISVGMRMKCDEGHDDCGFTFLVSNNAEFDHAYWQKRSD